MNTAELAEAMAGKTVRKVVMVKVGFIVAIEVWIGW